MVLTRQRHAQRDQRIDVIRLDLQGPAQQLFCAAWLASVAHEQAQIVERLEVVRMMPQEDRQQASRLLKITLVQTSQDRSLRVGSGFVGGPGDFNLAGRDNNAPTQKPPNFAYSR